MKIQIYIPLSILLYYLYIIDQPFKCTMNHIKLVRKTHKNYIYIYTQIKITIFS